MNKIELAKMLEIIEKNDPMNRRIKNYGVLMFAFHPEQFIPYTFTVLIVDMFGTKRKMESKRFYGPIWKQYYTVLNCSESTATTYIKRLNKELEVIATVDGQGKGKYRFCRD